jgi:hypothetical protein
MHRLIIARISTGSVYRLVILGSTIGSLPIFAVLGVLAYFGYETLHWNDTPVTGLSAVVIGPLFGIIFALTVGGIGGTVMALGLWLYSKVSALTLYVSPRDADPMSTPLPNHAIDGPSS